MNTIGKRAPGIAISCPLHTRLPPTIAAFLQLCFPRAFTSKRWYRTLFVTEKKKKKKNYEDFSFLQSTLATGMSSRERDAGLGCQQHPSLSCDSAPHSANTECRPAVHFSRGKKKKKKKKDCVCNSCEGLSVCIVLSCTARIKYALKYRIGFIDCISLLMSHPRQALQCARVHTNTWFLLQKACHQSAGGSKWEPAWFFSFIISPNSMLLKANSEDGPGNWNPSQQGERRALPLLQVRRDLGRKERAKGEKHHHRGAHYHDCFCYSLSL